MKFTTIFASVFFIVTAITTLDARFAPALEERALVARQCADSNCFCNKVSGTFCGDESINEACTNGHVFQCNGDDGTTCSYGFRVTCAKCGKLSCP
ncbi:hypothetical protein WG66_016095 [Moniliophthora roreri]|uniref:Small secreted protein n=1 Tax=Moniliophthora roreri TaxID=221103 RepID=A0A0W0G599_MONRR|nr:hypothetical protein WG66_016095 [Moniliophthora roreri]